MAQKDANLIDESQVKEASGKKFIRFYGEDFELDQPAGDLELAALPEISFFGISREHPLDGKKILPFAVATGKIGSLNRVDLQAQPGEYLVFQVVVWNKDKRFTVMDSGIKMVSGMYETCSFSREKTGYDGKKSYSTVSVEQQETGIFWFGLQIRESDTGTISGVIHFTTDHAGKFEIPLTVNVSGEVLKDGGENDDFRMARLKWLNSTIGLEDEIPAPYTPLRRDGNKIFLQGHIIELNGNGLPCQIYSGYTKLNSTIVDPEKELFSRPPQIELGDSLFSGEALSFYEESSTVIKWVSGALTGEISFDGTLRFHLKTDDRSGIRLNYTLSDAPYMLGLGVKRPCIPPETLEWHWDPARWEDSFWAGNIDSGCILRLISGNAADVPLLNCYYDWSPLNPPESWYNHGNGGITLKKEGHVLHVSCFSGTSEQTENAYDFELRLTPFHRIDYKTHWQTRFFHPHMHSFELKDEDCFTNPDFAGLRGKGVNCLNVHHAISLNPIINYPFSAKSLSLLQKFVNDAHKEGFKVLLYYTVRELSVHAPEFKALYSLNGEIFFPWQDNGKWPVTTPAEGPDPWFKTHLDYGFLPAWTEVIKSGPLHGIPDRSLITTPRSRLENFYLEGLRFLLERCPIDGLYLDDCDLSEIGMARLKRIFRKYRGADPILDFHAWESFNSAYCVPLRDVERFPHLTRLWLGEGVRYDQEAYVDWLIRLSGFPFGLTSEMLGKGNPYLGILFGMTNRFGWGGDPSELWKLFDRFGIADAEMLPDFCPDNELGTDHPEIHATLWKKSDGKALLAIGSWSEKPETIRLKLPGFLQNRPMRQPEIPDFQMEAEYSPGSPIEILPKQGLLLIL